MTEPIKVYIDHNILNDIAPKNTFWKESDWGKFLLQLTNDGKIEVWASPGNCMEIALTPDYDQRQNMAAALNTLIRGQRMIPAYETYIVRNFLEHLSRQWPGLISFDPLLKKEKQSSQIFIGLLGQLAALKDYDCKAGFPAIIKPKIVTQIIHNDLFQDAKNKLKLRIEQLKSGNFSRDDTFKVYDKMSIDELQILEKEIRERKHMLIKKLLNI